LAAVDQVNLQVVEALTAGVEAQQVPIMDGYDIKMKRDVILELVLDIIVFHNMGVIEVVILI
jgi:hypothetical protein